MTVDVACESCVTKYTLGVALVLRDTAADHQRGLRMLEHIHDMCLSHQFYRIELPGLELFAAREIAESGDHDSALPLARKALNDLFQEGQRAAGPPGIAVLVELLLGRGATATWSSPRRRSTAWRAFHWMRGARCATSF
jgi:hypothetical protein